MIYTIICKSDNRGILLTARIYISLKDHRNVHMSAISSTRDLGGVTKFVSERISARNAVHAALYF